MQVVRIAAFSSGTGGGNPAGVVITSALPGPEGMLRVAREVGYSETVFAAPSQVGWTVRYFSPDAEIPFCGHATIALGAVLGMRLGAQPFRLDTQAGPVTVEAIDHGDSWGARLRSPRTWSKPEDPGAVAQALEMLGLRDAVLDGRIPPARIHAGADHLVLALRDRSALAAMQYEFLPFQSLMRHHGWVTVMLCHMQAESLGHVRNPFAYGGVYEDPATGAAAAALAAYLRDLGWPSYKLQLRQGEDMGVPCLLHAQAEPCAGAPVLVSGRTRLL